MTDPLRVTRRSDGAVFCIVMQARSIDGPVTLIGDAPPFEEIETTNDRLMVDFDSRQPTAVPHPPHRARPVDAPLADDPMARAHVDVSVTLFGGSLRLHSASGELESLWLHMRDGDLAEVTFDRATGQHRPAAVRVTPDQARVLADVLLRYAASHKETDE
jgi:hypothetical protein